MAFSWQIFLVMVILGALQLAVGVALGRWLPARGQRPVDPTERHREQRRLRYFADRLTSLMQGVAGEVGEHRDRIDQVNRELAAVGDDDERSVTEFVLGAMTRIVQINERLQSRLTMTEQRLQEQTEQIQTHFAEARTDPLTGLMNRRALDDAMRSQMTACRRGQGAFSLVMADVDHFKCVNDSHGHPGATICYARCRDSSRNSSPAPAWSPDTAARNSPC